MRNFTAILCLTLTLLFRSVENCESADFQKGLTAAQSGDYATTLREWKPLAKQGDAPSAQYNLGAMYAKGQGVIQDNIYAHMWGHIASSNGNVNRGKLRDIISELMTPSQLEKAQGLAR